MPHIISTMTAAVEYALFDNALQDGQKMGKVAVKLDSVIVQGGANNQNRITTPLGVATPVTDEQLELLRKNKLFAFHEANGAVKVVNSSKVEQEKADKIAKDMTSRDDMAPLSEAHGDFEAGGRAAGTSPSHKLVE